MYSIRIESCLRSMAVLQGVWIILSVAPAKSQEITGAIVVNVTDTRGAVVAGAQLTLINTATNAKSPGVTGGDGVYSYNLLPPGDYTLTAQRTGFQPVLLTHIGVSIGEHVNLPVHLQVGSVTQAVVVSAASASLLNSESASVGQAIRGQIVGQLPLNGRNFVQLLNLATGAAPPSEGNAIAATWTGRPIRTVVLGWLRESDVSYLVNGIETRSDLANPYQLFSWETGSPPRARAQFEIQAINIGRFIRDTYSSRNLRLRLGRTVSLSGRSSAPGP